jgi:hypothetical protein
MESLIQFVVVAAGVFMGVAYAGLVLLLVGAIFKSKRFDD